MYKHILRSADQYFDKNIALGSGVVCSTPLRVGRHLAGLGVIVAAAAPMTLAAGDTITLSLLQSADERGPFAAKGPSFCIQASAAMSLEEGDILLFVALPDCDPFVKVVIDGGGATGQVDVFLSYIAR